MSELIYNFDQLLPFLSAKIGNEDTAVCPPSADKSAALPKADGGLII